VLLPPVKGAQGQDEPVSASLGQRGRVGTRTVAGQAAPEAHRGDGTDIKELVERQEDGGRLYAGLVDVDTKHSATTFDELFSGVCRDARFDREQRMLEA
jgi:hypothetical protein